jgi:hypothetical protein
MRRICRTAVSALAGALLLPLSALAGPVADFERDLTAIYAHYRAALFQTNQNNKAATEKAIADFEAGWTRVVLARRASPPPQYADDPKWTETLGKVDAVLIQAKADMARGELAKAHETLEAIRDLIGYLHLRNGIVTFSDRMNAYHEQMEHLVEGSWPVDADGLGKLREETAVLAHLAAELERFKPAALPATARSLRRWQP